MSYNSNQDNGAAGALAAYLFAFFILGAIATAVALYDLIVALSRHFAKRKLNSKPRQTTLQRMPQVSTLAKLSASSIDHYPGTTVPIYLRSPAMAGPVGDTMPDLEKKRLIFQDAQFRRYSQPHSQPRSEIQPKPAKIDSRLIESLMDEVNHSSPKQYIHHVQASWGHTLCVDDVLKLDGCKFSRAEIVSGFNSLRQELKCYLTYRGEKEYYVFK